MLVSFFAKRRISGRAVGRITGNEKLPSVVGFAFTLLLADPLG
jgi:hypothetical protein